MCVSWLLPWVRCWVGFRAGPLGGDRPLDSIGGARFLHVAHVVEPTLTVGLANVAAAGSRAQQIEDRDREPAPAHPNLGMAQFAVEIDPATTGCGGAGPVLDPASADPTELVVNDVRAVGHE